MGARFTPAQRIAYRAATGVDPAGFRIAHASLSPKALSGPNAVFVHRDNPLVDAELPDLARVFTEAGPHLWGELGATGPMARTPIKLAGLLPETPLALEFADALFPGRGFAPDMAGYGQSRDVIAFVGSEPLSLGFAALNRASDSVRALGLRRNAAAPAVLASAATLRSGAYPLDRHLWLYARQDCDGHLEPLPRAYIDFALCDAGQRIIGAGSLGYIPLESEERRAERARLG
jgi:phosphate transport system substrate-binding protein